jgi:nucleotide-binding universal stress UspA family protein
MTRITTILCPTDFSSCAQAALPIAFSLARDYSATLILLHVRPVPATVVGEFGALPPEQREPIEALKTRMRQWVPANFRGIVDCHIQDGDAAEKILKTAHQRNCDLIVLGTHGRSGLRRILIGSVAEAVLRKASCPVLSVKPRASEPAAAGPATDSAQEEPSLNSSELVTVCSVANPVEAEVIRNALKGESIPSFVEGAQQAGLVGTLGVPIRIQVRVGDFNRASKFIQIREAHRQVSH